MGVPSSFVLWWFAARREAQLDVWRITVAALRRWYVLLPLLALTAFGAYTVGEGVAPQYEVRATAILVPGSTSAEVENPYGSLDTTATVLEIVLDDAATRDLLDAQGYQRDFEFGARSRTRIMDLTVLSDSPERSLSTGEAVLALASEELAQRQESAGIRGTAQVGMQVLQAPSLGDVVAEGKMRNMAVVGIVGAALSLLVAVLFDDIIGFLKAWRRRRRERKRSASDHPSPISRGEAAAADGQAEDLARSVEREPVREHDVESPSERDSGTADDEGMRGARRLARSSRQS